MKKTIIILLLWVCGNVFSQEYGNRFQQNDGQNNVEGSYQMENAPGDPPSDDDPTVPIDDYIPLLAITAVGLIVCYSRKRIIITKS